jgi:hypothetical protein
MTANFRVESSQVKRLKYENLLGRNPNTESGLDFGRLFLTRRGVERGDIGLHAELFAGRLARPLDDHAVIAVQLLQKPS